MITTLIYEENMSKSTAHKSQLSGFCCKQEGGTLSLVLAGLKLLRKRPANISLKYTRKCQTAGSKKFHSRINLVYVVLG